MDPATAAGLGLSAASLALQMLEGCIKGYEAFVSMADMPQQYEHLRLRMILEQSRLLDWAEKVGLLEDVLDHASKALRLYRNVIIDILSEIQDLFRGCLEIQSKVEDTRAYRDLNPSTKLIRTSSQKHVLFSKVAQLWGKAADLPIKLQWAFVKQEKLEGLVGGLISYNDSIVSLLDRTTIQQIYDSQVLSHLTLLQLTSKVEDLHELVRATQVQTNTQSGIFQASIDTSEPKHPSNANSFARLASFKAKQLTLEAAHASAEKRLINRFSVRLVGQIGKRTLAIYLQERVWVEWKDYDPEADSLKHLAEARVQKLANLLSIEDTPQEFRAPRCAGYIHDADDEVSRFGLLYRMASTAQPEALINLIQTTRKPSLTNRIGLSFALAKSLLYLHSVNWLHKGVRSENILFLTEIDKQPDYVAPIISGFEYARQDLPEEQTEKPTSDFGQDVYRHPDAIGRADIRSRKTWDIYSLGVVLIEIALWQRIEEILTLKASQKGAYSRLRKLRDELLLEDLMDQISAAVGDTYTRALRWCIEGSDNQLDESNPEVAAEIQQRFSENVVEQLRNIRS